MTKGGSHFANFFEAVRNRKKEHLTAEIEEGAASTVLVHLANIATRAQTPARKTSIWGDRRTTSKMVRSRHVRYSS